MATSHHMEAPPPPYEVILSEGSSYSTSSTDSDDYSSDDALSAPVARLSLNQDTPTRKLSSDELRKPIALPAVAPDMGSPFMRAYPPTLDTYGISKEVFLNFVDDLNRVAVKNPPLQVLALAGSVVSFVPEHTAHIVGESVQAAARLGIAAINKGRTELALRKANRELFTPRGLKCEVARLSAVAKIAEIPGVLDNRGKVPKDKVVLGPIENLREYRGVSTHQRRLNALSPYIARLEVDNMPQLQQSKNPLSQWSASNSEKQRKKEERKTLKSRLKAHHKASRKHDKIERRQEKRERKMEKLQDDPELNKDKIRKLERKMEKREFKHDDKVEKIEKRRLKRDKEEKNMKKILWLIIRNVDAPSGLQEGQENPYLAREGEKIEELDVGLQIYELDGSVGRSETHELEGSGRAPVPATR